MQSHEDDEIIWKKQELESLQDCCLNYYDTVRISITDYEHVNKNQFILTYVFYLIIIRKLVFNQHFLLYFYLLNLV